MLMIERGLCARMSPTDPDTRFHLVIEASKREVKSCLEQAKKCLAASDREPRLQLTDRSARVLNSLPNTKAKHL